MKGLIVFILFSVSVSAQTVTTLLCKSDLPTFVIDQSDRVKKLNSINLNLGTFKEVRFGVDPRRPWLILLPTLRYELRNKDRWRHLVSSVKTDRHSYLDALWAANGDSSGILVQCDLRGETAEIRSLFISERFTGPAPLPKQPKKVLNNTH